MASLANSLHTPTARQSRSTSIIPTQGISTSRGNSSSHKRCQYDDYRPSGSDRQRDIEYTTAAYDRPDSAFHDFLVLKNIPNYLMHLYGILLSIRTYLHIGLLLGVVSAVASNRLQPTTHHYSFLPHAQQKQDWSPVVHSLLEHLPHTIQQVVDKLSTNEASPMLCTDQFIPSNSLFHCIDANHF